MPRLVRGIHGGIGASVRVDPPDEPEGDGSDERRCIARRFIP